MEKKIHYCWFGSNPKSELMQKCINSWKTFLPDYELVEWNDNNISQIKSNFFQAAIKAKKWAFAADYARLWALYNFGGIYFDTDVEALKSFDDLLDNKIFIGIEQFTDKPSIESSVIGAEKGNKILKDLMSVYDNTGYMKKNGRFKSNPMPKRLTQYFKAEYDLNLGRDSSEILTIANEVKIYPYWYFSPHEDKSQAYTIHHFADSWEEPWGVRTWLNTRKFRLHIFRVQNENAKQLPLLDSEELLFYLKLSKKRGIALVKRLDNLKQETKREVL